MMNGFFLLPVLLSYCGPLTIYHTQHKTDKVGSDKDVDENGNLIQQVDKTVIEIVEKADF